MTGIPRIPSVSWALIAPEPERTKFARQCALSAMQDGEKIIDRIAFWMAFGFANWWVCRLAERLDETTDEIESLMRIAEECDPC